MYKIDKETLFYISILALLVLAAYTAACLFDPCSPLWPFSKQSSEIFTCYVDTFAGDKEKLKSTINSYQEQSGFMSSNMLDEEKRAIRIMSEAPKTYQWLKKAEPDPNATVQFFINASDETRINEFSWCVANYYQNIITQSCKNLYDFYRYSASEIQKYGMRSIVKPIPEIDPANINTHLNDKTFTYKKFPIGGTASEFLKTHPDWDCDSSSCTFIIINCAYIYAGESNNGIKAICETDNSFAGAYIYKGTASIKNNKIEKMNFEIYDLTENQKVISAISSLYGEPTPQSSTNNLEWETPDGAKLYFNAKDNIITIQAPSVTQFKRDVASKAARDF